MVAVALAIILPPLWRQPPILDDDADERNLTIARQRLRELDDCVQAGALSQADYASQRSELELTLSDDLAVGKPPSAKPAGRWLAYCLVLAIPLVSAGLYAQLGHFQAIEPTPAMLGSPASTPSLADIENMVGKLALRMQANPDDSQGWLMLGKSYKHLQQHAKAAEAFRQAYRLLGEQADVLLLYADALALVNNGQLAGEPADLIAKALKLEPQNASALWLAGMAKAQAGDSTAAAGIWQKLAGLLPPGSPEQQEVHGLLAQIGAAPNTASPASEAQTRQAASIRIHVSLAPELRNRSRPGDSVFIYAQALSGAKMPLAIVHKTVANLPLTVTLSDAQAMMPHLKLSNFAEVKLLARVTQSGAAAAQAGDLLGSIDVVAVTDKTPHTLVIDTVVE